MKKDNILIIGANGQIGSVLTQTLRSIYGHDNVIASDIRPKADETGPFELINVLDRDRLNEVVDKYQINQIYHLAAILSAKGELNPLGTWDINMNGLFNILELAREKNIEKIFYPSSIAVFGPTTPPNQTPQETVLTPTTVYGMSKVAGEYWTNYYFLKYGVDVRSVRYPGIIGYQSMPGGGTTDYAVDIFHEALKTQKFTSFLSEHTELPMIYMEDAIRGTIELMDAPLEQVKIRTSYNLAAMSFTPEQIANEIKKHIPEFQMSYAPDYRQAIADSWPNSIDDRVARADWGWKEAFGLPEMVQDMLKNLR
jgi:threonine 3-dehydrogenase